MARLLLWAASLAVAIPLSGQVPIEREPKQCLGLSFNESASKTANALEPRQFAITGSGICNEYSWYGWTDQVPLYLGQGALKYIEYIEKAVGMWNEALDRSGKGPAIRIVRNQRPRRYQIPDYFWDDASSLAESNSEDRQSVIYFQPDAHSNGRGFTKGRRSGSRMVEADIYINDGDEVEYGSNLALTYPIVEVDDDHTIYAFTNVMLMTIVHEIGHLLGLNHIPVSGNAMSYRHVVGTVNQWSEPMALWVAAQIQIQGQQAVRNPSMIPFVVENSRFNASYVSVQQEDLLAAMDLYSATLKLGEQDRTALMCIYDF